MKLSGLRIAPRLTIAFALVFVLIGSSSLLGLWRLGDLSRTINRLVTDDATKLDLADQWEKHTSVNLVRTQQSLISNDAAAIAALRSDMEATTAAITGVQKKIESLAVSAEEKRLMEVVAQIR